MLKYFIVRIIFPNMLRPLLDSLSGMLAWALRKFLLLFPYLSPRYCEISSKNKVPWLLWRRIVVEAKIRPILVDREKQSMESQDCCAERKFRAMNSEKRWSRKRQRLVTMNDWPRSFPSSREETEYWRK